MNISFSLLVKTFPQYLPGIWLTFQLLVISISFGFIFGLTLALMKKSDNKRVSLPARFFIYYFRGTPFLVQLFLIYYGAGQFEIIRESFLWYFLEEAYICALIALVFNNASYAGEIIYNGILTTDKGEVEAAKSFGMNEFQLMKNIVIPSALRRVIPAYGNEIIFMLHATSLVSVVSLVDITGVARLIQQRYYATEAYLVAGLLYLIITFFIVRIFKRLELRYHQHLVR